MKWSTLITSVFCLILFFSCSSEDDTTPIENPTPKESIYFPTISSEMWDTKSLSDIGCNETNLQPLLDFLEDKNNKGFIMLHNGKIIVEAYMNGHNEASPWYWASAGKTLTTAVTGIAQD